MRWFEYEGSDMLIMFRSGLGYESLNTYHVHEQVHWTLHLEMAFVQPVPLPGAQTGVFGHVGQAGQSWSQDTMLLVGPEAWGQLIG